MSQNISIDLKAVGPYFKKLGSNASRYAGMAFFLLLAALYGFVLFRINSLIAAQPDQATVEAQVQAAKIQRVDAKTAAQLESLEANSSNVKALFDQARQNPFE